jgi:hypothetical protein
MTLSKLLSWDEICNSISLTWFQNTSRRFSSLRLDTRGDEMSICDLSTVSKLFCVSLLVVPPGSVCQWSRGGDDNIRELLTQMRAETRQEADVMLTKAWCNTASNLRWYSNSPLCKLQGFSGTWNIKIKAILIIKYKVERKTQSRHQTWF